MKRIGVVIPALNEEKGLSKVLQEIPKNWVQDIIVVDNGSTDSTVQVARSAGVGVIQRSQPGYGGAVQAGINALPRDTEIVVILDADHSDYPQDLELLVQPILTGEADFVSGNRTQLAEKNSLTPQQIFGNRLACFLIHVLYSKQFSDLGPFRAIRKSAYEKLEMRDPHFGWNVEMNVKAVRAGLKIKEVPVRYRPRIGKSKISGTIKGTISAGTVILYSVFRYGFWRGG